ncbi:MAG: hypothetical protein D6688_01425 [Alphaproteobacteria bacterium]|nr:MAG: hypothetical protein D6688_01425 [Alphaproteobacteria bacterium]
MPLWQLTQSPVTKLWSKAKGAQSRVVWQSEQRDEDGGCFFGLPLARRLLWHPTQVTGVFVSFPPLWHASQASGLCAPSRTKPVVL